MQKRVKICGLKRFEDADAAAAAGAWALGFIAYERSPRYISPDSIRKIIEPLRARYTDLRLVGVFVNPDAALIGSYVNAGINLIQLHGNESEDQVAMFKQQFALPVIKAIRLRDASQLGEIRSFQTADYILLDAFVEGSYGGTGKTLNWQQVDNLRQLIEKPLILSGGLKPENVSQAWTQVQPFALDLASGVEASPGIKDAKRIKAVFESLEETI